MTAHGTTGDDERDEATRGSRVSRHLRILLVAFAVVVVAFCAWSMSEYTQGRDPLAWLTGSGALTTTNDTDPSGTFDLNGDASTAATTATLSHDDVVAALGALQFDGADVSVPPDQATVVLTQDGIWVDQVELDDAPTMASLTARRAAALATWEATTGVEVPQVTWIAEDGAGAVRMAVSYGTDDAPTSGDLPFLLSRASSYALSGDAYASLGIGPDCPQSTEAVPTLPDASPVSVEPSVTSGGEVLTTTSTTGGSALSSSGTGSVPGSDTGGGSSSGSGATATPSQPRDPAPTDARITVTVTVDGSAAGRGSNSVAVTVPAGSTAYDALVATGVGVNARQTSYGVYVSSIGGLAEKEHGSGSGWTYAVNGIEPDRSAASYTLSEGDVIVWSYVNVTQ